MTFTNISLTLYFLSDDLDAGQSRTQVINGQYIVKDSVTIKKQLLNGLKPSSNQVTLQLEKSCSSIESIIKTDGDIKAVLKDGNTFVFTGYLSTNLSWTVTQNGQQALSVTIEDIGTRLLSKTFIDSGYHLFNCTAHNAISAVCNKAGVYVSAEYFHIETQITKVVDSSAKCQDIITQILYELGYVYYFDNLGELRVFKVDCTSTDNLPVYDKDSLYVVSDKAISLSKKIRTYKSARVEYTALATVQDYLIYRNTTDSDDSHPYCNLELEGGQYFDGTEIYSDQEWQEETEDVFREDALIEACNASSETDIIGSNNIVSVSDVRQDFTADDSTVTSTITGAGGPYIKILAHNRDIDTHHITKLDAYATVIYEKSTNIVRTDSIALTSDDSDTRLDETLEYVHTQAQAQNHANLLGQYNRYCNSQYTFYSKQLIALGSIIKLHDNIFSGLKVNVMVIASSQSDSTDIVTYTAIGISVFDLTEKMYGTEKKTKEISPLRKAQEENRHMRLQ